MRNIIRYEYGRARAWLVKVHRRHPKKQITKLFSFGPHGGIRKALAKAVEFRDAVELRHPPRRAPGGDGTCRRVHIAWATRTGEVSGGWFYLGTIRVRGVHKQTKWSIAKWGEHEARRRCEAWLRAWRKQR